jgi:uroporphyrinogen decarboxylase
VVDYGTTLVALARALDWDYVRAPAMPIEKAYSWPVMTGPYSWRDDEGREFHFSPDVGSIATCGDDSEMTINDLPDPQEPFVVDPSEMEAIRHVVAELGETHFVVGRSPVDGTFPFQETVGMQEFLLRMITDPEFVRRAIEAHVARSVAYLVAMLEAGCDAVMTTDDYCDNMGPMMGPERFRQFILPGIEKQVAAVHAHGGFFIKHTDGNLWSILDELVGVGIDAWHGIQPRIGMDLRLLKQRFGDRLCFFGGVNCETLIEGPPEKAREEVRYAIESAARGGGLVITSGNVLQPGTQLANYLGARQATRDYGAYPLR